MNDCIIPTTNSGLVLVERNGSKGNDARNHPHCRRSTDDGCVAWLQLRKSVAVLRQECRRYAKGADELLSATGGRTAIIYEYHAGSVAYFAPDAAAFSEAGELQGDDLVRALSILESGACAGRLWIQTGKARRELGE